MKIEENNNRYPRLWVGIGCQFGVSKLAICQAIEWLTNLYELDPDAIVGLATLDRKVDEIGLLDYSREAGLPLQVYSAKRLNAIAINVDRSSRSVLELVGTGSVAEAAALCAAQTEVLLVPKHKYFPTDRSGWITLAIAIEHTLVRKKQFSLKFALP